MCFSQGKEKRVYKRLSKTPVDLCRRPKNGRAGKGPRRAADAHKRKDLFSPPPSSSLSLSHTHILIWYRPTPQKSPESPGPKGVAFDKTFGKVFAFKSYSSFFAVGKKSAFTIGEYYTLHCVHHSILGHTSQQLLHSSAHSSTTTHETVCARASCVGADPTTKCGLIHSSRFRTPLHCRLRKKCISPRTWKFPHLKNIKLEASFCLKGESTEDSFFQGKYWLGCGEAPSSRGVVNERRKRKGQEMPKVRSLLRWEKEWFPAPSSRFLIVLLPPKIEMCSCCHCC